MSRQTHDTKRTEILQVRLTKAERLMIRHLAALNGESLSHEIRRLIREGYAKRGAQLNGKQK